MMLDRPRHKEIVEEIRAAGASLRMISDGDIAAAMAPSLPDSDVDLYMGIGGSPEAVLAAAGIKCLGGDMQCKMWPRDEKERKKLIDDGHEERSRTAFTSPTIWRTAKTSFSARPASATARLLRGVRAQGAHGDHPFDPDAGEEQDRALHSRPARFAEQNDPAALG